MGVLGVNPITMLRAILAAGGTRWTFGGAYIFWGQVPVEVEDGGGEVLYCGEAQDLSARQAQHLTGPGHGGNKFAPLSEYFASRESLLCGLALLVIPPRSLPWMESPDDGPVLENGAPKRAGEALEGLLLRASMNLFSAMPLFNTRADASKFRHDDDVVRFLSLIRYLLDYRDVTMDFTTFWIRAEEEDAAERLVDEVRRCKELDLSRSSMEGHKPPQQT
jgi:hypothetical protein